MKKLSDSERRNLSVDRAYEILSDFGKYMESSPPMYNFESSLPWDKSDVLFAAWFILSTDPSEETKITIYGALLRILDVLPDPEDYASLIVASRKIRVVWELTRKGYDTDEITKLCDRMDFSDDNCIHQLRILPQKRS